MTRNDFAEAYRKGYTSTVGFLLAMGIPAERVDDVAQAGWARGWERRKTLDQPNKILPWIKRISLNLFRNELRREKQIREEAPGAPDTQPDPAVFDLRHGLGACNPAERRLLELYYVEGYSSPELGRIFQCSAEAVRVRVYRAKRRLVRHIAPSRR